MKAKFVDVAPAIPLKSTGRQTFTYEIQDAAQVGTIVTIPFGPRRIPGVVMNIHTTKPPYPTKVAITAQAEALNASQIAFGQWLATVAHGGLGYTLRLFFPPKGPLLKPEPSTVLKAKKSSVVQKTTTALKEKDAVYIEGGTAKRHQFIATLAQEYIRQGKQLLVIVPEISHLNMIAEACQRVVPREFIAIVSAGQGVKQLRTTWHAIHSNQPRIVIGTQKAFFLPWQNLGAIVLEQEHYTAHKLWDQYPRLDSRYASRALAAIHTTHVLVTSSIASLATQHRLQSGELKEILNHPLDIKAQEINPTFADKKARYLLPQEAGLVIQRALQGKKRVFVLYNKRGAWALAACRKCHTAVRCQECGSAMTVHAKASAGHKKKTYTLQCRHCAIAIPMPKTCPNCGKGGLQFMKPGGETIETILKGLARKKNISRLDADTLFGRDENDIKTDIERHQLLLGTSAALTHLEGESIDLVVWLHPEDSLLYPDVRSTEKTFYMLARLAALSPKKPVILVSRQRQLLGDTVIKPQAQLYEKLLKERKRLFYPPWQDMVKLTLSGRNQPQALLKAEKIRSQLDAKKPVGVKIKGPFASLSGQTKQQNKVHILLLGPLNALLPLYKDLLVDSADLNPERIL